MLNRGKFISNSVLALIALLIFSSCSRPKEEPPKSLMELYEIISTKNFIDLTHSFEPGIPNWSVFPKEKRETITRYEHVKETNENGFFAEIYTHVGQWGTHVNAPSYFAPDLRTLDQIRVKKMFLPLVLIDVHNKVLDNPDYTLTEEDVWSWVDRNGSIPEDAFVVMRTDWSKRWPDKAAMQNEDENGVAHYPGWSQKALTILCEVFEISAIGYETQYTDPGIAVSKGDHSLQKYFLSQNLFQIELLTNLDKLPEFGALAVVSFPKPKNGSGFPARVFAIAPN